eukprot:TRINITY_DN737_c1_g1_i3.p1 TRINITY_DN737_c1_g1~~TRINITY_DN737_c1_g1_i3.p1  ORF type:complete len:426 (+),score=96.48 TRINITY_DN737_c1_g1_i3:49-1278(+)
MSDITWFSDGYAIAEKSAKLVETFFKRHKKGGKHVNITLMGQKCTIDFDKMQMTKDGEKKKYKLKRQEGDSSSEEESEASSSTEEEATWEYKDPKKGWLPMKTGFQLALEKAYNSTKGSKSLEKKIGKQTLHFDLKGMTQKDESSGVKCKIRRVCDGESSSESSEAPKKKKPAAKGKSKSRKDYSSSESESESDDAPSPSKSKTKNKPKPKVKSKRSDDSDSEDDSRRKSSKTSKSNKSSGGNKKKLIKKGRGVVEPLSGKQADCHILERGDDVYQCMLNQSNVHANNNKFYQIQLIEADSGNRWWVFTRWGRIGVPGSTGMDSFNNADAAIAVFKKRFRDKTMNSWDNRKNFVKHTNKYQLMDITLGQDSDSEDSQASQDDVECTLDPALKSVIEMISFEDKVQLPLD